MPKFGRDPRFARFAPNGTGGGTIHLHNRQGARIRGVLIYIAPPGTFTPPVDGEYRVPIADERKAELGKIADWVSGWVNFVDATERHNDAPQVPCSRALLIECMDRWPWFRDQIVEAIEAVRPNA